MSEGFLSRWSRRKRGEAQPEPERAPDPPVAEPAPAPAAAPVAEEEEPAFDLSQLPPLDSLTAESDFSVFFQPGVPAAIRGAALRKAWVADPLIRDYVSSLDYGWDFNAPGGVPGFALDLGETGERLKKLIAQAVGERAEDDAPPPAPPTATGGEPAPEAEAAPALLAQAAPALLAQAAPPLLAETAPPDEPRPAPPAEEEPPAAPARRHGGAVPV